jgi:hypothetical protein
MFRLYIVKCEWVLHLFLFRFSKPNLLWVTILLTSFVSCMHSLKWLLTQWWLVFWILITLIFFWIIIGFFLWLFLMAWGRRGRRGRRNLSWLLFHRYQVLLLIYLFFEVVKFILDFSFLRSHTLLRYSFKPIIIIFLLFFRCFIIRFNCSLWYSFIWVILIRLASSFRRRLHEGLFLLFSWRSNRKRLEWTFELFKFGSC